MNGFCEETNTVYEFCGCYWHGQTSLRFCDVTTGAGDTLAERCEKQCLVRNRSLRQSTKSKFNGYVTDKGILADHPELTHLIVQHSPLNTRDALYWGRTEGMRLHYKIGDNETIM